MSCYQSQKLVPPSRSEPDPSPQPPHQKLGVLRCNLAAPELPVSWQFQLLHPFRLAAFLIMLMLLFTLLQLPNLIQFLTWGDRCQVFAKRPSEKAQQSHKGVLLQVQLGHLFSTTPGCFCFACQRGGRRGEGKMNQVSHSQGLIVPNLAFNLFFFLLFVIWCTPSFQFLEYYFFVQTYITISSDLESTP